MAFKIQKADLMEGMKVAKKVIGRSAAKIADAEVELAESDGGMTLRACFPGLCYLGWNVPGKGSAGFDRLVVPLDKLRGLVDRMPAEEISVRIDPKNDERLRLKCGQRSGLIPIRQEPMAFKEIGDDAELTHEGEMKPLSQAIRLFDKVSLKGFNAWGCVCAAPDGTGYATDEGNMIVVPFPLVEKCDHPVMLPTKVLVPATMLTGDVEVYLTDKQLCIKNSRWTYLVVTTYVKAPNYERVIGQFTPHERAPIDIDSITKEVRDFRKACKDGALTMRSQGGVLSVIATRDASISYKSERDVSDSPNFELSVIPENYMKVGPSFKKGTEVAIVDGSHLFLMNGDQSGIVSCIAGTIKFS